MKRAKAPPSADLVGECMALHDILMDEVNRRDDFVRENPIRLLEIKRLAISEYLRIFPKRRKNSDDAYVMRPDFPNRETHYDCLFCRENLVTTPFGRPLTEYLMKKCDRHAEKCGVAMLAGLMTPVDAAATMYVIMLGDVRLPGVFHTQTEADAEIRRHRVQNTPARPRTDYDILAT